MAAEPAPPTSEQLDKGVSAAQEPLRKAAHIIRQVVEDTKPAGYMSVAFGEGEVELYWKGALPAPIEAAVAEARKIVPVKVVPAKYSYKELDAASEQVRKAAYANRSAGVRSVRIPYDGSGLRVGVDQTGLGVARATSAFTAAANILPKLPVAHTLEKADLITKTGRLNDHEQWLGGGRIRNYSRNFIGCTGGFGVQGYDGYKYILTAGHCGKPGDWFVDGVQNNDWVGQVKYENTGHDTMLIASNAQGSIWDGPADSYYHKPVVAWDWVYPNELFCSSGSYTGVRCGLKQHDFTAWYCDFDIYNNFECYDDLIEAHQVDGLRATQPGDSGGPVFTLSGSGVVAKGIISGHGVSQNIMYFQDFATARNDFPIRFDPLYY
ncbi:S1 family peptidase [Sphaerisporangium sp. NPDC051017]|uniref:S1 family peptidase n=1 Tax=Sphaerisporangium sp. NPDC051017 TaxID=3154636 RepID=UPI003449A4E0